MKMSDVEAQIMSIPGAAAGEAFVNWAMIAVPIIFLLVIFFLAAVHAKMKIDYEYRNREREIRAKERIAEALENRRY